VHFDLSLTLSGVQSGVCGVDFYNQVKSSFKPCYFPVIRCALVVKMVVSGVRVVCLLIAYKDCETAFHILIFGFSNVLERLIFHDVMKITARPCNNSFAVEHSVTSDTI
jgi:hypothetical protein